MTIATLSRQDLQEVPQANGFGACMTERGNLPLEALDYHSRVRGLTMATQLTQCFRNDFDQHLEATYVFPLPSDSAVTSCVMKIGDRTICAKLKERAEARAEYDQAIAMGKQAAIAEEERSETFSLRVGNLPPGESVEVVLSFFSNLSVVSGEATLRLPLVVAPRYAPGNPLPGPSVGKGVQVDTDQVPDASRITPPTLLPGVKNPVRLSVVVELDPGDLAIHQWQDTIKSSLHDVRVESIDHRCQVTLGNHEKVDRDFILRFQVAKTLTAGLWVEPNGENPATFAINVVAPKPEIAHPRDVVFLLDNSGSMRGWKMEAAKRAVARVVDTLSSSDRFQVFAFESRLHQPKFQKGWVAGNDPNRWNAVQWIASIHAQGGTEMGGAIRKAINCFKGKGGEESRSASIVLITDGHVAGEDSIMKLLAKCDQRRRPRIFTLGVDRAVNASILTRLSQFTGGTFELVESEQRLNETMVRFSNEIGVPAIRNLEIIPDGFEIDRNFISPSRQKDLYHNRPLRVFGRIPTSSLEDEIRFKVTGILPDGSAWEESVTATAEPLAEPDSTPAILPQWGRARVRELEDQYVMKEHKKLKQEIVHCSLESNVLCRFTAYVAVDDSVVNESGEVHDVIQPVEMPEGWATSFGAVPRLNQSKRRRVSSWRGGEMEKSSVPPPASEPQFDNDLIFGAAYEDVIEDTSLIARDGDGVVIGTDSFDQLRSTTDDQDELLEEFLNTEIEFTAPPTDLRSPSERNLQQFMNIVLEEAKSLGSSHIYFQSSEDGLAIWQVANGKVSQNEKLSKEFSGSVIEYLKQVVGISTSCENFTMAKFKTDANLRVYFIPSDQGMSVLIRVLNQDSFGAYARNSQIEQLASQWLADANSTVESQQREANWKSTYESLLKDSI